MMNDMYTCGTTALFFYTNDERVTCDIIIRQLNDLPSDDKVCYIWIMPWMICHYAIENLE